MKKLSINQIIKEIKEIINPRKSHENLNFPNMKLTIYPRLTGDQARKYDALL